MKVRVATFLTPATSKMSEPMIPPRIFKFSFSFEKFVNIFADVIASSDKATAVGPENNLIDLYILFFLKPILLFYYL